MDQHPGRLALPCGERKDTVAAQDISCCGVSCDVAMQANQASGGVHADVGAPAGPALVVGGPAAVVSADRPIRRPSRFAREAKAPKQPLVVEPDEPQVLWCPYPKSVCAQKHSTSVSTLIL